MLRLSPTNAAPRQWLDEAPSDGPPPAIRVLHLASAIASVSSSGSEQALAGHCVRQCSPMWLTGLRSKNRLPGSQSMRQRAGKREVRHHSQSNWHREPHRHVNTIIAS